MPISEHQYNLGTYSYCRKDKGIAFKIDKKNFTKIYNLEPTIISKKELSNRFFNELTTYKYLKKIEWPWSPKLISYSVPNRRITIEGLRVKSIHQYLCENTSLKLNWLFGELKKLEFDLISKKINCKGITNKDILVGLKQIWLVDFEETKINENYLQSLFFQLLYDFSLKRTSFYLKTEQRDEYKKRLFSVLIKQFFSSELNYPRRILRSFFPIFKREIAKIAKGLFLR